nr:acetyltransferase [uncultured Caldimonas sp.]
MNQVLVIGAGGHARVLADVLLNADEAVLGFTDENAALHGGMAYGLRVLGSDAQVLATFTPERVRLVNGIGGVGGGSLRRKIQQQMEAEGWQFVGVRHGSAVVSQRASVDATVQLLARCVVQIGATVGRGCIVNTGAIVEHDCSLGEYVHVAPGAVVCGDVHIGDESHIGAGAVLKQGIRLGPRTLVAAGAVVTRDFNGGGILIGAPARPKQ